MSQIVTLSSVGKKVSSVGKRVSDVIDTIKIEKENYISGVLGLVLKKLTFIM